MPRLAGRSTYGVEDVAPIGVEVHDAVSRLEVRLTDPDGNGLSIGARTGRPADGYTYPDAR